MKRFGLVLDDTSQDMPCEPPRKKANLMQKLRQHDADIFEKVLSFVTTETKIDRRIFGPNRFQIPSCIRARPEIETPKTVSPVAKPQSLPKTPTKAPKSLTRPKAPEPKPVPVSPEIEMVSPEKGEKKQEEEVPLVIPASPVAEAEGDAMIDSPFKPRAMPEAVEQLPGTSTCPVAQPSIPSCDRSGQEQTNEQPSIQASAMIAVEGTTSAMAMDIPEPQPQLQHPPHIPHHPTIPVQPRPVAQPQPQPFPQPTVQAPVPQAAPQAAIQGRRIRKVSRTRRNDEMTQDEPMQTMGMPEPRLSVSSFGSGLPSSDLSPGGNPFGGTGIGPTQSTPFQPSSLTTGGGFFGSFTTPSNFGTPSSFNSFPATPATSPFPSPPSLTSPQQNFGNGFFSSPQRTSFGSQSVQSPQPTGFEAQPPRNPQTNAFGMQPVQIAQPNVFGTQPTHNAQGNAFESQIQRPVTPAFGSELFQSPPRPPFGHPSGQSPPPPPVFGQQPGQSPASHFGGQPMTSNQPPTFGSQKSFGARPSQPTASDQPFMANAQVSFSFGRLSTPARRTRQHGRRKARN